MSIDISTHHNTLSTSLHVDTTSCRHHHTLISYYSPSPSRNTLCVAQLDTHAHSCSHSHTTIQHCPPQRKTSLRPYHCANITMPAECPLVHILPNPNMKLHHKTTHLYERAYPISSCCRVHQPLSPRVPLSVAACLSSIPFLSRLRHHAHLHAASRKVAADLSSSSLLIVIPPSLFHTTPRSAAANPLSFSYPSCWKYT